MRRRRELILAILKWLSIQETPCAKIPRSFPECPDVSASIVKYHVTLCEEAGFIRRHSGIKKWHCLTWNGHERLDREA